jgi:hypothetical protein
MVTQHREGIRLVDRVALHALCQSLAVPASMKVLGDWNWYLPKWLEWLPRVGSEGGGPSDGGKGAVKPKPTKPAPIPA